MLRASEAELVVLDVMVVPGSSSGHTSKPRRCSRDVLCLLMYLHYS